MYADWSVELGADDPVLDFPWTAEAASDVSPLAGSDVLNNVANAATLRFYDLKSDPALIDQIPEAQSSGELRNFLLRVNAAGFPLQTAKCDHWFTHEISDEEEFFGVPCKYGSYVDLLFTNPGLQLSFPSHEEFAETLCNLLKLAPDMKASAEVMVRRCFYATHADAVSNQDADSPASGYYFTVYVSGFGETEASGRQQWGIALALAQHALVQSVKGS